MKDLSYTQYYNLITKAKGNPYLYVSAYKEAKNNLETEQFHRLQEEISGVA